MPGSETPVDLVVFDLDGTLVQFDFTAEGMERVRNALQDVFDEVGIEREFKPLLTELEDALDDVSRSTDTSTAARIRRRAFQQISEMELDAVSRQYVYKGSQPVLEEVASSDATLAVATNNTRDAALRSLEDAGLPEPDYLVAVDDIGRPKPARDMIERLFSRCDSTPDAMVMVGDRPSDATSASRACSGTETDAVTVLLQRDEPGAADHSSIDHTITSLSDLLDVIRLADESGDATL